MSAATRFSEEDLFELRLLIEELVCDVCRFRHMGENGDGESVRIRQQVQLSEYSFADILVDVPQERSYVVEVDYGYTEERLLKSIARKYAAPGAVLEDVRKLVLIVDDRDGLQSTLETVRARLPPTWELEIWDNARLGSLVREHLDVPLPSLSPDDLGSVRSAIDLAKGRYAFGDDYANDPLDASLLWVLGHWKLRRLFEGASGDKRSILVPGSYSDVVVVFADLCGFSSYVRDTRSPRTIRDCLSAFCTKSRYQILNDGGLLYQFLGDAVIGLFGIPQHDARYVDRALACAQSLQTISEAISIEWQRQLDRIQPVRGAHIGVAMGDLQIISLRPFSRTHLSAIGDTINMAARLSTAAQPGQVMISNSAYRKLTRSERHALQRADPVEAKNIGTIQAWCSQ